MKKGFLITVSIWLILFSVTAGTALGQTCCADLKIMRQQIFERIGEAISIYKLGTQYEDGKIVLTGEEKEAFKTYALNIIEEAAYKISVIENDRNFSEAKKYLPDKLVAFWEQLAIFADDNLSPEGRLKWFVASQGGDCFVYIQAMFYAILAGFLGLLLLFTVIGIPIAFIIFMLAEAVLTFAPILWFLCVVGIA